MKIKSIVLLTVLSSLFIANCDRPECLNTNMVFVENEPNSKVYKDELVRQLNDVDQTKLTYWLQRYDEQDGDESLYFYIQGDGLCAILHLSMDHWNRLENVRERKGIGRRGAEFTNLKFEIIQDSISTNFVYSSYDRMID